MEIWDLYDAERRIIGAHVRGTEMPENGFHLVVHVWIQNREGKYLMTQRAANKPTFPLMWECVGGSALQGEGSLESALREVKEEVGVELDAASGRCLFTKMRGMVDGKRYNDINDVWLFRYDGEIRLQDAETDEVCRWCWMDRSEIDTLRREGKLVHSIKDLRYFFDEMAPQ